jgi:hypothetical protein
MDGVLECLGTLPIPARSSACAGPDPGRPECTTLSKERSRGHRALQVEVRRGKFVAASVLANAGGQALNGWVRGWGRPGGLAKGSTPTPSATTCSAFS